MQPSAAVHWPANGVNGADSRVYYLDAGNRVIEFAWNNGWVTTVR
jgi:hypothetical protein